MINPLYSRGQTGGEVKGMLGRSEHPTQSFDPLETRVDTSTDDPETLAQQLLAASRLLQPDERMLEILGSKPSREDSPNGSIETLYKSKGIGIDAGPNVAWDYTPLQENRASFYTGTID